MRTGITASAMLVRGTYKVREVMQTGWMQTTANPSDITSSSNTKRYRNQFRNFQYANDQRDEI